ncbi:AAA family ATPase [Jiangella alba]|uniref:ATPase AAA-type core domain-containing protein n=1 Tax=Jiangella alba TaxID=561176 RepID=A0A1H5LFP1_9ACTN|nr:ATP-binding protein [Jiangella alba]SEE75804.1 hypothetical protein SAMN04488561_2577 [Jiangella alba]
MLRSFRVANHRSIRDEQELVLLPAYDKPREVVPVAAIFGANAGGKTTVLDALGFLQRIVRDSYRTWEPGSAIPRSPFLLDPARSLEPSTYAVDLVLCSVRYVYGISIDDRVVRDEWLYRFPHGRKQVVFERDGHEIRLGFTVSDYRGRQRFLNEVTRGNASALGAGAMIDLTEVEPVYDWFRRRLRVHTQPAGTTSAAAEASRLLRTEGTDRDRLVEMLRAADLGITDLQLERALHGKDAEHMTAGLDELMSADESEPYVRWPNNARVRELLLSRGWSCGYELRFVHGQSGVALSAEDQSAGTLAWLGMLVAALDALTMGGVLCVDEIDASLHPRLTAQLVSMFKDEEANPKSAQLVFTTHDASLLGTSMGGEVLARDEVWFVEKDRDGATTLFPLTDFKPRQHENTERRYLGGSYGAVPIVSDDDLRHALAARAESD